MDASRPRWLSVVVPGKERSVSTTAFNKVALVTGAASGIGRASAQAFVSRGYATVLVDRDEARGRETETEFSALGTCCFVSCDVADDLSVKQAVATALERYGRLDAAFNAAGIDGDVSTPLADASMENWQRVMAINLTGLFSCLRYQIPAILDSGGGRIVNCASVAGLIGAPMLSAYVAAKHGAVGLTKAAALEYSAQGLLINAICPAMINTPLSKEALAPEVRDMMLSQSPIGRFGEADNVASLVLWLCDRESNQFVTGQAIAIDGGWTTR